jgi:iron complex transport system ATP-binding protein
MSVCESEPQAKTTTAIRLDDVCVSLSGREVVSQVSLNLTPGCLIAFAGPNGAGKTTLLRAIAGLVPASGKIMFGAQPILEIKRQERARRIAYLPQGHQVHWPLTVRNVVALGRFPHGLADPEKLTGDHARAVEEAMVRADVLAFADRSIQSLSGGERARVMLARVLCVEAPVILADEPTASLDPRHQISVLQDLKAESRRGALVIVVTHDIWLASRLADAMVLMDKGRVIAQGAPHEVLSDARLADVYGITVRRQSIAGENLISPWGLS